MKRILGDAQSHCGPARSRMLPQREDSRDHGPWGTPSGGFTMVELTVVAVLLGVVLMALGSSAGVATRTMAVAELRADTTERVLRFYERVTKDSRAGVLSTYRVEATAADVAAGRAGAPGDWIDPVDGEPRDAIQFRAADGILAMNAGSLTEPMVLRFRIEAGEDATPGDDDGDGLVDEGSVTLGFGSDIGATVLTGVSSCEFVLDGNLMTVRVGTAVRTHISTVFQFEQVFTLRNN